MIFLTFLLACAAAATGVIFQPGAWYDGLRKPGFTRRVGRSRWHGR